MGHCRWGRDEDEALQAIVEAALAAGQDRKSIDWEQVSAGVQTAAPFRNWGRARPAAGCLARAQQLRLFDPPPPPPPPEGAVWIRLDGGFRGHVRIRVRHEDVARMQDLLNGLQDAICDRLRDRGVPHRIETDD